MTRRITVELGYWTIEVEPDENRAHYAARGAGGTT